MNTRAASSLVLLLALSAVSVARADDAFRVSAWVEMTDGAERQAADAAGRSLDQVDLFNFAINGQAGLAEGALAGSAKLIQEVHARGAKVSITFIDWVGAAHAVAGSEALSRRFARTLGRACTRRDVDAVCLDFEKLPRALRRAYVRFVRIVADELHARGKTLTVAVHAMTSDEQQRGLDIAGLGEAADALALMTYDYSGAWSSAGPIGPMGWARRVVEYVRGEGVPARKIILGIPLYGRSWPGGRNIGPVSAARLARDAGASVLFDPQAGEAHFRAGGKTVWFSNGRSVEAKVALARELGLGGVACFSFAWASDDQLAGLERARAAAVAETGGVITHLPD